MPFFERLNPQKLQKEEQKKGVHFRHLLKLEIRRLSSLQDSRFMPFFPKKRKEENIKIITQR